MDRPTFLAQYPEFSASDTALVDVMLAAAATQLGQVYWGSYYDQGHGLLTASMLARAPEGQTSRLQSQQGTSTYQVAFEKLRQEITFADRVF
jgi:hypothetical protein